MGRKKLTFKIRRDILLIIGLMFFTVILIEIIRCLPPYLTSCEKLKNQDILVIIQLIFLLIGGFWALRLYYIANIINKGNYLKTYVSTIETDCSITISTILKNETTIDRKIHSSFLIITKQGSDILDEVNSNFKTNFKDTNSFSSLKFFDNHLEDDFAFIRLPYYYEENIKVGNEDLSYSIQGLTSKENSLKDSQIYEVRYFVYRYPNDSNPYHRIVQATFKSNVKLNALFNKVTNSSSTKLTSNDKKATLKQKHHEKTN